MSTYKRYLLFTIGIFFMSLGIAAVIKSSLGTSPISSIPYILSLQFPLSIGAFTFIVNMLFLLIQIIVLRSQFQYLQLLQIPVTIIFSFFIDFNMYLLSTVLPELYISRFITMLLGTTSLAFGVALQIIADVVNLAGEGVVNAIATRYHFDFGNTKTVFDSSLVIVAAILSYLYFDELRGIREGTFISALITGTIARFLIHHLSCIDANGRIMFQYPNASLHKDAAPREVPYEK